MKKGYWNTVAAGFLETLDEKKTREDKISYIEMRLDLLYKKGREDIKEHLRTLIGAANKEDVDYLVSQKVEEDEDIDTRVGYYNE